MIASPACARSVCRRGQLMIERVLLTRTGRRADLLLAGVTISTAAASASARLLVGARPGPRKSASWSTLYETAARGSGISCSRYPAPGGARRTSAAAEPAVEVSSGAVGLPTMQPTRNPSLMDRVSLHRDRGRRGAWVQVDRRSAGCRSGGLASQAQTSDRQPAQRRRQLAQRFRLPRSRRRSTARRGRRCP